MNTTPLQSDSSSDSLNYKSPKTLKFQKKDQPYPIFPLNSFNSSNPDALKTHSPKSIPKSQSRPKFFSNNESTSPQHLEIENKDKIAKILEEYSQNERELEQKKCQKQGKIDDFLLERNQQIMMQMTENGICQECTPKMISALKQYLQEFQSLNSSGSHTLNQSYPEQLKIQNPIISSYKLIEENTKISEDLSHSSNIKIEEGQGQGQEIQQNILKINPASQNINNISNNYLDKKVELPIDTKEKQTKIEEDSSSTTTTITKEFSQEQQNSSPKNLDIPTVKLEFDPKFNIPITNKKHNNVKIEEKSNSSVPISNQTTDEIQIKKVRQNTYNKRIKCYHPDCFFQGLKKDLQEHIEFVHYQYECDICLRKFKSEKTLNNHINMTHNQNLQDYFCEFCNYSIKCPKLLEQHIERTHNIKNCPVKGCEYLGDCRKYMIQHLKQKHSYKCSKFKKLVKVYTEDLNFTAVQRKYLAKTSLYFEMNPSISFHKESIHDMAKACVFMAVLLSPLEENAFEKEGYNKSGEMDEVVVKIQKKSEKDNNGSFQWFQFVQKQIPKVAEDIKNLELQN